MNREDLITEISARTDIPMENVEEILDEEDILIEEELRKCRKKKCIVFSLLMLTFIIGAAVAVYILDRKEKIDIEAMVKKYMDKIKKQQ